MSAVVEVPLVEGGDSILIEVSPGAVTKTVRGRSEAVPKRVAEPLDRLLAGVAPLTQAMLAQLSTMGDAPEELEIEFGIKLSADAKIVIAHTSGEANFRLMLKWVRPQPAPTAEASDGRAARS